MFNIVFFEIILISIIGLIILGPERLPLIMRTFRDRVIGIKLISNSIKTELAEELDVKDLSTDLKKSKELHLQNFNFEVTNSIQILQEKTESVYHKTNKDTGN